MPTKVKSTPLIMLALYALYLTTFGLAAFEKIAAGSVPEWFQKQFGGTFLNFFHGALPVMFYSIAACEMGVCFLFLWSLVKGEFKEGASRSILSYALILACFTFVILGAGMRLTHDFNTAFELFGYFSFTFLISKFV